jgi:hypothetical protein
MYDRPIEIMAYSSDSMRTFHEQFDDAQRVSIKLSYHGLNHYNSVVRLDWTPSDAL